MVVYFNLKYIVNYLIYMVMKNLLHTFGKNNLDEVVFENRNKAYGAYVLRNEYSSQLTKALFAGVAFFASVAVVPLIISAFKTEIPVHINPPLIPFQITDVDAPDLVKPTPVSSAPANIKTVANPDYTPVRDVKKETKLPTKEDFDGAAIGTETKAGESTTIPFAPPALPGPPSVSHLPAVAPVPAADPDKLINQNEADISASFKGGMDAFRQKVSQNFDTSAVDQSGVVSATVTFIVERDGSISNIKVTGNNSDFNREAERTIRSVKSKWSPAMLKGKTMRSSFRMPISMQIE